jgi:hypothetical protein
MKSSISKALLIKRRCNASLMNPPKQHLRPAAVPQNYPAEDLIPDPEYFDNTNVIDPDYGDAETMPEMGDNYLSTKLMLPKGGVMVKGRA